MNNTIQANIDALIAHIDQAYRKNSVTNVQVAAIFDFLNKFCLREDKEATLQELFTFLKGLVSIEVAKLLGGLEVGETVDSLIGGKGVLADTNGRIQADRLELRDSLVVMRLLINEISAMAGDYSFSDAGYIQKVESLGEDTYRLYIEKRTDADWTTLDVNDVLYSIVNSLLAGGSDYYTSWFRVLSKNTNDNTLTVVCYPDSEVPGGKNYPPVEGYNVTRRGNSDIPAEGEPANERAQSWLLSSREGKIMFLQNVYKPILESYNYALTLGKFPRLPMVEKLPIGASDVGVMSKIAVFEKVYEADWNGDIVTKKVDRGAWSAETAAGDSPYRFVTYEALLENQSVITNLEQHTVWHYGCKWACLIDKTTDEPKWNSAAWQLIEGDTGYALDFESSNGWQFLRNNTYTEITAIVYHSNRDITAELMVTPGVSVEWLRDTGNVPADNTWRPTYVGDKNNVIALSAADMGSGWGYEYRKVSFTCRIYIPVGNELKAIENRINYKI